MNSSVDPFMNRALSLAALSRGDVLPNPMVGAVIVKNGEVIGEGRHLRFGGIHAEEAAIRNCKEKGFSPEGAELYVTLEPCCFNSPSKHNGPCTEKILDAGIGKVIIARADPNPLVRGKGIAALGNAGIQVVTGLMERESAELNRVYEALVLKNRPYVHLKAAVTLDGFLAASDGSSKWISSGESRAEVMMLRRESDAILVGRGTVVQDRPGLSVREPFLPPGEQPFRVVLSSTGKLPEGWPSGTDPAGDVIVYHNASVPDTPSPGVFLEKIPVGNTGGLSLPAVLESLYRRGVFSLLVEGGSRVYGSFIRSGFWDRITVYQSPDILGSGYPLTGNLGIESMDDKLVLHNRITRLSGRDVVIRGDREEFTCLQV